MRAQLPSEADLDPRELGALWHNLADGLFFQDLDGTRAFVTPRLVHLLRIESAEALAGWDSFRERVHAEDRPELERRHRRQLETGEGYVMEVRVRRGDGQTGHFVLRSEALGDAEGKVRSVLGSLRDITPRRIAESILNERQAIAEMIALDRPLEETLAFLADSLERRLPDCVCSILLVDLERGVVLDGAGPSLPEVFRRSINGLSYGPRAGACGTAVFRGEPVFTRDIATDPLWENYRSLVLPLGLRSCWSYPIRSADGEPLGTFAVYGREPRLPDNAEIELVGRAGDLAGVAILRSRERRELRHQIELLQAAEERFGMVVRASLTGFWDWDIRRNTLFLSDEWKAQLGCRPDELPNDFTVWDSRLHPDDRKAALAKMEHALLHPAEPYQSDFRLRHQDGSYRWILSQGRVIADENGEPVRMIGTHVDVTDVKQAQEAMLRQSRLLDLTQSAARVGGWEYDRATGTMFWTPEAFRLHEVAADRFTPSMEAVQQFHPPETRGLVERLFRAALEEARSWDEEFEITTARGRLVWLRSTGHPVLADGAVAKVFGTWQDITDSRRNQTALRQSESVLRAVARVARLLLSADTWTGVSADALAILGEGSDASHVHLYKIVDGTEAESFLRPVCAWHAPGCEEPVSAEPAPERTPFAHGPLARWHRLLDRGTPIHGPIVSLPQREQSDPILRDRLSVAAFPVFRDRTLWGFLMLDEVRTQRVWSAPELHALQTAAGLFSEAVSRAHELAERARFQQKLQESQKLETLGVLAGGIAHDFNNLLTAVLGNATIARAHLSEPQSVEGHLSNIEGAARRAAELCQQMLAYAGKGRFEIALLDLNPVVSDIGRLIRASISKTIEVLPEFAAVLPPVMADAVQIRQVILNLILNAADAIGEREGTIILRTSVVPMSGRLFDGAVSAPEQPEANYVSVEVADNGCGMKPEVLARIFDPFYSTKFTGRGLGLAAVLGIVRSHQGALFVSSREGVGTTFRMLLPAATAGQAVAATPPPAPVPAAAPRPRGGLVLVIDDESSIRQLTGQMLRRMGFDSVTASDGHAGVSAFEQQAGEVRLVLLDIAMPRMDGPTALAELRRRSPGLPIILMSGYSEDDAAGRFAGVPRTRFMQKPFGFQQLKDHVTALLESIC